MEADWSAEVGPGLAIIDTGWPGFIDLRTNPAAVHRLPEAGLFPPLAGVLVELNAPGSPVFTSKCDFWALDPAELDPMEFDADPSTSRAGLAVYLDLIPRSRAAFASFAASESLARAVAAQLRRTGVSQGRVDLVIRAAEAAGLSGFGLTLYAAGCGPDPEAAREALKHILQAAATVTMLEAATPAGE